MPQLIWSAGALKDMQRIYRFLEAKSPNAAKRATHAIRTQIKIVAAHPGVGRPVADMPEIYREWLIDFGDSGYIARYRLNDQNTVILGIRHQKEAGF